MAFVPLNCASTVPQISVIWYNKGNVAHLEISTIEKQRILEVSKDLFYDTSEVMKLLVSEKRIQSMMETEQAVEIVFDKPIDLRSQKLGYFKVKKLFVPFSGPFVGNEASPVMTIFFGENQYSSGPLRNMKGYFSLVALKGTIQASLEKEK